jgi:hypothetical protein
MNLKNRVFAACTAALVFSGDAVSQHGAAELVDGPGNSEQSHSETLESSTVQFSGTAKPGSLVHDWITELAGRPLIMPVGYTIQYASTNEDNVVEDLSSLVFWARSPSDVSTTQNLDNDLMLPMPDADGSFDGELVNGCALRSVGNPPRLGTVRYEWRWMQVDTNNDRVIDDRDGFGWALVNTNISYPPDTAGLPQC